MSDKNQPPEIPEPANDGNPVISDPSNKSEPRFERRYLPPRIPGYTELKLIDVGGMGAVYEAQHERMGHRVAIKVIHEWLADENDLIRFDIEAKALALLDHPNIVRVNDNGEAGGRPYLVMEYLAGGTLKQRLKAQERLKPKQAAELLGKLADGINAAHNRGVVHRDLKPANILFDAADNPKVSDFGVAKLAEGNDITVNDALIGSPPYMSPEQADARGKFAGPPSDIFTLGVILYECLVGSRPFHAETRAALLTKIIQDMPVNPTKHNPEIPRGLERIVLKCLEKDPGDRYPTAKALAEDLTRFVNGEPISVHSIGLFERTLKWAKRKPDQAASLLLTFAVVVLLAFGVSLAFLWQKAEAEKRIAQKATDEAMKQTGIAQKATDEAMKQKRIAQKATDEQKKLTEKNTSADYGSKIQYAHALWRDNSAHGFTLLEETKPNLRGWEYNYVRHLWPNEIQQFKGHTATVKSVSWGPDSSLIATASDDGTARIWDARTRTEIRSMKGHASLVNSVSWSPDGSLMATASDDGTARIWDVKSGTETLLVNGQTDHVTAVSWSPDGSRIATANDDGARIWDVKSGIETCLLKGHIGDVNSISWSPDGSQIVTGGIDRTARIWDAKTGAQVGMLNGHSDSVTSVSWSPDGSRIATASADKTARIWDAKTGVGLGELKRISKDPQEDPRSALTSVSWSPDGSRIATASQAGTVCLWDARTKLEDHSPLSQDSFPVNSLSWSPDGLRIATASDNMTMCVWDARTRSEWLTLKGHTEEVNSVSWSPDGSGIATASNDRTARIWNPRTGVQIRILNESDRNVTSVSWGPDGSGIATAHFDGLVKVWHNRTGSEVLVLNKHSKEKAPGLDVQIETAVFPLRMNSDFITSMSWSPDGSGIATAHFDGLVRVWDVKTGNLVLRGYPVTFPGNSRYLNGTVLIDVSFFNNLSMR